MLSDGENKMEMVLPMLVTDAMQILEKEGKHPGEDFTKKVRTALIKIISEFPDIEEDIWDDERKKKILMRLCPLIDL
ncbi:hypothetical protein HOI26_03010 [Candidatus Woesearchaeota archaeon]|jgi:hypothetical protein|nr:hypothetical protein [Candidatus Woesearchaeota archaeon]MBT5740048.1 hypothetical protein [Candidatus Woesearchaeota archaeon]